jgi:hypothetical protein
LRPGSLSRHPQLRLRFPVHLPSTGTGASPYGPPPPLTAEELQLTQQLFNLINHGRAVRGLYPFVWNAALAGPSNPPWAHMYEVQESMVNEPPSSLSERSPYPLPVMVYS